MFNFKFNLAIFINLNRAQLQLNRDTHFIREKSIIFYDFLTFFTTFTLKFKSLDYEENNC